MTWTSSRTETPRLPDRPTPATTHLIEALLLPRTHRVHHVQVQLLVGPEEVANATLDAALADPEVRALGLTPTPLVWSAHLHGDHAHERLGELDLLVGHGAPGFTRRRRTKRGLTGAERRSVLDVALCGKHVSGTFHRTVWFAPGICLHGPGIDTGWLEGRLNILPVLARTDDQFLALRRRIWAGENL